LRQLVTSLYRDRAYLEWRTGRGRKTAVDYAVERDMNAVAWAVRALVRYVPPAEERGPPEPPTASQRHSVTAPWRPDSDAPPRNRHAMPAAPAGLASPSGRGGA